MNPRIAIITVVKNEEGVIEAFVRHNLSFCDIVYAVDNASLDSTPAILNRLAQEGLPLVVTSDASFGHSQSARMAKLYNKVLRDVRPSYVLPFDADELIQSDSRSHLLDPFEAIPKGGIGSWQWMTYLPWNLQVSRIVDRFACRRLNESQGFQKTIISVRANQHDRLAWVHQGSPPA